MKKKRITIIAALVMAVFMSISLMGCNEAYGKSAYELACDNGFVGTQQEWLDSLKGSDGKDGKDGRDGEDGKDAVENIQDFDLNDFYELYKKEHPNASFVEFMNEFVQVEIPEQNNSLTSMQVVAKGIQSVVSIRSTFSMSVQRPGGGSTVSDYSASGSGVAYRQSGNDVYIITNYHVVYDRSSNNTTNNLAKNIVVFTYGYEDDEYAVSASFIGGSITKDIAVIKADLNDFSVPLVLVDVFDSNKLSLGEKTIAIGNPLGEGISVTEGVLSVDSQELEMEALDSASKTIFIRVLRTDTSINGGNSGGALFNAKGQLIGIVNAKTVDVNVEGMGYAIPSNVARGLADCIIDNNSTKCVLGISVDVLSTQTIFDVDAGRVDIVESLVVESISSGSLAASHLQVGDKLLDVTLNDGDTLQITRLFHLSDFLYNVRQGDSITLSIERDGEIVSIVLLPESTCFTEV